MNCHVEKLKRENMVHIPSVGHEKYGVVQSYAKASEMVIEYSPGKIVHWNIESVICLDKTPHFDMT